MPHPIHLQDGEEVCGDSCLCGCPFQEFVKFLEVGSCSPEVTSIVSMDVGWSSYLGNIASQAFQKGLSCDIGHHFKMYCLSAKTNENTQISLHHLWLTSVASLEQEWSCIVYSAGGERRAQSDSAGGELAHHLRLCLGSGSTADNAERIHWHATPKRALHFGGLWEAAVKSAKTHIKTVVVTQLLNFEELSTVAAQVEPCLNSRPLIATTSQASDGLTVLTLAHFLIGRPTYAYPEIPSPHSTNAGTYAKRS